MKKALIEFLQNHKKLTIETEYFKRIVYQMCDLVGRLDDFAEFEKIKNELICKKIIKEISKGKKIKILREKKENEVQIIKNNTHWNKAILAIAMDEKNLDNLKTLQKINDFLNKNSASEEILLKERSFEIFQDEKFLDSRVKNGFLFDGKLSLKTLKCKDIPSPLVCEKFDNIKAVLICENSNTFHTMCRWNKEIKRFGAVVYGSGNVFSKSHFYLEELQNELGFSEIFYFGDFDYDGFFMPANTNQNRVQNGLTPLKPALFLYEILITFAPIENKKTSKGKDFALIKKWINDEKIYEFFTLCHENGTRIPQEAINYEVLKKHFG